MSVIFSCGLLLMLLLPAAPAASTAPAQAGYNASSMSTLWYLAEGCTIDMETWVLVQNPNAATAVVNLGLFTAGGAYYPPDLQNISLSGYSRRTFNLNAFVSTYDVSTEVTSDQPVICERAMYGPGREWATDSIGVVSPNVLWYLPEGCTAGGMETWVLIQNPYPAPTTASLTLMTDTGTLNPPELQNMALDARSRRSVKLNNYVNTYNVSTRVDSPGGVVCERAMYGPGRVWATDSIGARATATDWYFAEGCTAGGMETWILVQNPNTYDSRVQMEFCTDTGGVYPTTTDFIIPAGRRLSFNLGLYMGNGYYNLGTKVHCVSGEVICERAMYGPGREWATDSIGSSNLDYDWFLSEGCTAGGMQTWVLVMNPSGDTASFSVTFMTGAGDVHPPALQNITIYSGDRVSINAGLYVTDFNVSTEVTASGYNLAVERSMFGPGREWATNSIGCPRSY